MATTPHLQHRSSFSRQRAEHSKCLRQYSFNLLRELVLTVCLPAYFSRQVRTSANYDNLHSSNGFGQRSFIHTATGESSPRLAILPAFLDHLHAVPLLPTCGSLEWYSNGTIFGDGALTNCTGDNQNLINKAPSGGDNNRRGWSLKKGCNELHVLC